MSTVASLPFFPFTLPADALADKVDRQKMVCTVNVCLADTSLALAAFRHFIQDIGGLMDPATLLWHRAIFFLQSDPEAQRAIPMASLGAADRPQTFELPKQFTPGLSAFVINIEIPLRALR